MQVRTNVRIAVDAMGGDYAPDTVVGGALQAAQSGIAVQLFGHSQQIVALLDQYNALWKQLPITVVDCSEIVSMGEEPVRAITEKKDSSLVKAVKSVSDGISDAIVSAGNSGAVLVAGTLIITRVPGISRPAIGGFLPTKKRPIFCLDLGANTDCKPEFLEQFAYMGHVYVQLMQGIVSPSIALLSNGHEPYKGSTLVKEVYGRLVRNSLLNFVGNKEPRDIFDGSVDVVVSDGFSGNVMLKTAQSIAATLMHWIADEAKRSLFSRCLLYACKPLLKRVKAKADSSRVGGALLLGVKKPVIIAHGSSSKEAIFQAITFAHQVVAEKRIEQFNARLSTLCRDAAVLCGKQAHSELSL